MPPFFIFQTPWQKQFASFAPRRCALADIAQLGERQTEDLKVPGSIPGVGIALVAQSVEHGSNKPRVGGSSPSWSIYRSYSVMVITKDSDSFNPGSSPGRTFLPFRLHNLGFLFLAGCAKTHVLVAQLDKASDYESEDWGFKSLQGYFFIFFHPADCGAQAVCAVHDKTTSCTAAIAQLGERQTEDLKVPGSIPGGGIFAISPA